MLATVDSTNAEAARIAPDATGPVWIVALEQTGGHGRRGRPWTSPPGNFHGSLLMAVDEPPDRLALRSFAAALAVRDACVALVGRPEAFRLKWPNDVLLNGGKLAGILLEGIGRHGGRQHLTVGIGVNLAAAPPHAEVEEGALCPVSLAGETGLTITPETFLDALAPAFARWDGVLGSEGFAPLRHAWLGHAARLGQTIRARTGVCTREGVFETIDCTGALVLRTQDATLAIPAADVFF